MWICTIKVLVLFEELKNINGELIILNWQFNVIS